MAPRLRRAAPPPPLLLLLLLGPARADLPARLAAAHFPTTPCSAADARAEQQILDVKTRGVPSEFGATISTLDAGPEDAAVPHFLFIHGTDEKAGGGVDNAFLWPAAAELLRRRKGVARVLLPSIRGFGRSSGPKVRKKSQVAPEVGPISAFCSCIPAGMHGPQLASFGPT